MCLCREPGSKPASVSAAQIEALEGMLVHRVVAGQGMSLFLVDAEDKGLDSTPVYEPPATDFTKKRKAEEEAPEAPAGGKGGAKRGRKAAA